jgi:MFS transporter, PAT family, beta-lactamase induction signal transducer AmpG
VGLATATIGLFAIIGGTFFGGWMTERIGLGRALWIFGAIQAVGFFGYILVDGMTPGSPCAAGGAPALVQPLANRLVMYVAVGVENACQGMATGAFGVLLLRITQKQFSATQYALFSSVFSLGRTLAGPPAGFLVDAIGWTPFFLVATVASIPGLLLLQRFVPIRSREPVLEEEKAIERRPVSALRLALTSLAVGVTGFLAAVFSSALLAALKAVRRKPGASLDIAAGLSRLLTPAAPSDWIRLGGLAVIGLVCAGSAAAYLAARHGLRKERVES